MYKVIIEMKNGITLVSSHSSFSDASLHVLLAKEAAPDAVVYIKS